MEEACVSISLMIQLYLDFTNQNSSLYWRTSKYSCLRWHSRFRRYSFGPLAILVWIPLSLASTLFCPLKDISKHFFIPNHNINCELLNIYFKGSIFSPRVIHNFWEKGVWHPHGLEPKGPAQTRWAMIIHLKQNMVVVRVCAGQMVDCCFRMHSSSFNVSKTSIQPLLNKVFHLPFIDPSKPRPMKAQVHHAA